MRRKIGIIALILSLAFLAAVPASRRASEKSILEANRRYEAALYFAHVIAIDSNTSKPIEFELRWDYDSISPFFKGSGPTVVKSLADGSKILTIVGIHRTEPLRVEVTATGFQSGFIDVKPQGCGILEGGSNLELQTVTLTKAHPVEETSIDK